MTSTYKIHSDSSLVFEDILNNQTSGNVRMAVETIRGQTLRELKDRLEDWGNTDYGQYLFANAVDIHMYKVRSFYSRNYTNIKIEATICRDKLAIYRLMKGKHV